MNLTDVLERLEAPRRAGAGWMARCPAHDDRDPSLSINEGDTGAVLLLCFGGCDLYEITSAIGLRVRDLFEGEAPTGPRPERRVFERVEPDPEDVAALGRIVDQAAERIGGDRDHPAVQYAAGRFGLTVDDIVRLGLGYATNLGGGPRLVVPFRDDSGVARGMQARALDPTATVRWLSPRNPAKGSWSRIGWFPGARQHAAVLVTEGPGDALTAVAAGLHAVAIRGAGNAKDPATQDAVASLAAGARMVVCGDGDEAGQVFSSTLTVALRERGVTARALHMPDGADLTELRGRDPARFVRWLRDRAAA